MLEAEGVGATASLRSAEKELARLKAKVSFLTSTTALVEAEIAKGPVDPEPAPKAAPAPVATPSKSGNGDAPNPVLIGGGVAALAAAAAVYYSQAAGVAGVAAGVAASSIS